MSDDAGAATSTEDGASGSSSGTTGATSTGDAGTGGTGTTSTSTAGTFTQADLDRIVADRVARERAKYADYGDLKKKAAAAMTEQERAVADAEARGMSTALAASSGRLARAEFRAAAAGRVDKEALDGFLEYVDPAKFVGEDGEPDGKAIEAAIKKLAPQRPTNFDGGARTTAGRPTDMSALIRQAAGIR